MFPSAPAASRRAAVLALDLLQVHSETGDVQVDDAVDQWAEAMAERLLMWSDQMAGVTRSAMPPPRGQALGALAADHSGDRASVGAAAAQVGRVCDGLLAAVRPLRTGASADDVAARAAVTQGERLADALAAVAHELDGYADLMTARTAAVGDDLEQRRTARALQRQRNRLLAVARTNLPT